MKNIHIDKQIERLDNIIYKDIKIHNYFDTYIPSDSRVLIDLINGKWIIIAYEV